MISKITLATTAMIFMVTSALAQDHKIADKKIVIENPWARASIGKNGAAYVTVVNHGKHSDKLIRVMAPVAKRVQLHTHKTDNGIMRMRPIKSVPVPAHTSVMLKPSGHHIMMMGLTQKLIMGEEFPLTLVFENAGKLTVKAQIRHASAFSKPSSHGKHKMKH